MVQRAIRVFAAALAEGVAREEAMADQLGILSREADAVGAEAFSTAFLTVARLHRVAAIRNRARLAGLIDRLRAMEDDLR